MGVTEHKPLIERTGRWDKRLATTGILFACGLGLLLIALARVQLFNREQYRERELRQSLRIVRIPGVRGRILDRNGIALAETRPAWDLVVYLEDLRPLFRETYRKLREEQRWRWLNKKQRAEIAQQARLIVLSNVVRAVSDVLKEPVNFRPEKLITHYNNWPYRPFPLIEDLTATQVARFLEAGRLIPGTDIQVRPVRVYPSGPAAAHVVGYVVRDDQVRVEDEFRFSYSLPSIGSVGIEGGMDTILQGRAGIKRILVNSLCYRESESLLRQPVPGRDVVLSIDLGLQHAAYEALRSAGPQVKGAVVVLDPTNGRVLALVSVPSFDPNAFVRGISHEEWTNWYNNPEYRPMFNRATQGAYPPGSVFKLVTGLACFQTGVLNTNTARTPSYYSLGYYQLGRRRIEDTAPAGWYDFRTALKRSCNAYFIHYGLQAGSESIISLGRLFGLGEEFGIPLRQESAGFFPTIRMARYRWTAGNLANLCIGQEIAVTPLQIAVLTAAIVNGGKVFKPSFVLRTEGHDQTEEAAEELGPVLWRRLPVADVYFEMIKEAMLADTVDPDGTGYGAFHRYNGVPYLRRWLIGGKTGTAEIERSGRKEKVTWFTSFGPYEQPRYVVTVMIEQGVSGGRTCAPVARKIFQYLEDHGVGQSAVQLAFEG